jgi:hypothetical protein
MYTRPALLLFVCSTDLTSLFCLLLCSLLLAVVRSAGQVIGWHPCGALWRHCGATWCHLSLVQYMNKNKYINMIQVEPCGAMVAPHGATVAPHGSTINTWPADLTTANRSAHNIKQNKLVRSVEQTNISSMSSTVVLKDAPILIVSEHEIYHQKSNKNS